MKNIKIRGYHWFIMLAWLASAALDAQLATVQAQGTAFTYQGQLNTASGPASGRYDLTFTLYNVSSGGVAVAEPVTNSAVNVTNGLFMVLIDFGAGPFAGQTNWLEIGVATNGASSFSVLAPRQELTPTPYAIFAEGANAAGLSGTIPTGDLSGTYGGALTLNNAGNSFAGDGTSLINVDASLLDGLAAGSFWQTTGNAGTSPTVNFLGTSDNEPLILRANNVNALQLQYVSASTSLPVLISQASINVIGGYWGNSMSSGVIGGTIAGGGNTYRFGINTYNDANTVTSSYGAVGGGSANSAGNYGTVPGGVDNVASGLYGFAAGANAQALNQGAFVWADSQGTTFASTANDQFLIRAQGGVGIGTASPEQGLSVNSSINLDQAGLNTGFLNDGNTNGYGLSFGIASGEGIASQRQAGAGNRYGLDFYTDFAHRMSITQGGLVGIGVGTNKPAQALEVGNGNIQVDSGDVFLTANDNSTSGYGLGYRTGLPGISPNGPFLYGYNGGALGGLEPTTIALSWDFSGDVWVSNNCSVATLTIRGGADLAEPFKITAGKSMVPEGAVVVIDDQNPGQLKLTDQPYDTHVAGVVSGANGINPGIQMHQQGLLEGGKNVALSGRVYVQTDTSNGAIRPGDLLTTSGTPGWAMKVTDHTKAAGAILGKAMTGLSEGKGMVLVLVTLQ